MNSTLYAYLDIRNPLVAWEVAIGRVRSVSDVTRESFGVSTWTYSLLKKYATEGLDRRFINELMLESVRQSLRAPECSRLSDLYFFCSESDAYAALERWGLNNYRSFVSAVNFSSSQLTKVDSEWITSYLQSENTDWMPAYWQGKTLGVKPLTEVLARGIGKVMSKELRHRAYESIIQRWPTSTPLLGMACCAFAEHGLEDIALVRPAIVESDGKIKGSYFIDIRDLDLHQKKIISALDACKERGEIPLMIVPDDENSFFRFPDFSNMAFTFNNKSAAAKLKSVHSRAADA